LSRRVKSHTGKYTNTTSQIQGRKDSKLSSTEPTKEPTNRQAVSGSQIQSIYLDPNAVNYQPITDVQYTSAGNSSSNNSKVAEYGEVNYSTSTQNARDCQNPDGTRRH